MEVNLFGGKKTIPICLFLTNNEFSSKAVTSLQETEFARSRSPTASPVLGKKRGRIRSKSSLGENPKTLVNDLLKAEGMKR